MPLTTQSSEGACLSATRPVRLLLADEHALFRQSIRYLLEREADLQIVGEAATSANAISAAQTLHPDIVLLSLELPDVNGLSAADVMMKTSAASVITLTSCAHADELLRAVRLGARAYLLKENDSNTLMTGIRCVARGEHLLSPQRVRHLLHQFERCPTQPRVEAHDALTSREIEVLKQVARGASNGDIARALGIKAGTVNNYVSRILDKLHLGNRTEAALYALRTGVATLDRNVVT